MWLFSHKGSHKRKNSASLVLSEVRMSEPLSDNVPLEARSERAQMNPRLWMVLGVSYVIIGEHWWHRQCRRLGTGFRH